MNACLNSANANIAFKVKQLALELDFGGNLYLAKKSGRTIYLN